MAQHENVNFKYINAPKRFEYEPEEPLNKKEMQTLFAWAIPWHETAYHGKCLSTHSLEPSNKTIGRPIKQSVSRLLALMLGFSHADSPPTRSEPKQTFIDED